MQTMSNLDPLTEAIKIVGLTKLAGGLSVSHQAVRKWQRAGRMPRTEWTGETQYWHRIQEMTANAVTRDRLLGKWPAPSAQMA